MPTQDIETSSTYSFAPSMRITLQVGESYFNTTRETLVDQSPFFSALLSGRWSAMQEDGSYFIDADGELFTHILRFLRRGVLPIFYDRVKGHDEALYLSLLEEARYFGIARLEEWLDKKLYLEAVKVTHSIERIDDKYEAIRETTHGNVELLYTDFEAVTTYRWECPHDGDHGDDKIELCKQESRVFGQVPGAKRAFLLHTGSVVRKETTFNKDICLYGR